MAIGDIGRLVQADESLNHQIADTFATVRESDRGWTEKIWASIARKDGGLQLDFGLGKYINRNVLDGFAGVSRNREQWTVRASRALASDLEAAGVGPVRYEIVAPLKKVRFVLERNRTQPIAFDVEFEGALPPFFEARNRLRAGYRVGLDLVRYHQAGTVSGWLDLDGERHRIDDEWFGFRDHSWGMRGDGIGAVPTDIMPNVAVSKNVRLLWGPWLLRRPDGSTYEIQSFFYSTDNWDYYSGHVNHADGAQHEIRRMTPHLRFDPATRAFLGGRFELSMASGEARSVVVEPLGQSGFHLRAAEYGSWKGGRHGSWRAEYHEQGEYIADCVLELPRLGQLRDKPVRVREGDAEGYGIQESIYSGLFPELGLGADSDHPCDL
ncbi:MAG: hypothetical protein HYY35_05325 [Deltaproteobacteria bacterium]|nr:hypothetical protein [Deltaproteobacteria bacterium]